MLSFGKSVETVTTASDRHRLISNSIFPLPDTTLAATLRYHAENGSPGGITFCEQANVTLGWEQLETAVAARAAQFVEEWDIPRESVVLLCGPNSQELVVNFLVQRIGAIPSIVAPNWQATQPFIESVLRKVRVCRPSAFLLDSSFPSEKMESLRLSLDAAGLRGVQLGRLTIGHQNAGGGGTRGRLIGVSAVHFGQRTRATRSPNHAR